MREIPVTKNNVPVTAIYNIPEDKDLNEPRYGIEELQ